MPSETGLPAETLATGPLARLAGLRLPWSTIGALGVRLGAAALAYLLQILLARSLGAAEYGTFSFAWSVVTIGGFLATLGFGQIAVRFLAEYHERGEPGLARGFLLHAILVTTAGSLVLAAILYALFPLVEAGYGLLCCSALAIGLLALPFFAVTDLVEGFARSQGWTIRALAPAYLVRTGLLMLALIGTLWLGYSANAISAMVLALGATIGAAVLQICWTMPALLRLFPPAPAKTERASWNGAAMPTLLSDLALLARQHIDLIILGLLAPPAVVGLYFAATRIASLIGLVEFAIGASFGHRFAREASKGAGGPAFREARRWMRIAGLGGAIALGLGTPLILSLFGEGFAGALWPTLLLITGAAVRMTLGPLEDLLTMSGFAADVWRANAIGALITATLCALLAGPYQAIGAAIAAMLGNLAAGLALALAHRRVTS
ncbi:MAG: lipopolysaccharide biosynthesis protein [Beijerinckiaceae bacterium]|jgi:O-antigen/teichoic acid export membrane protein|nr:lipopolysaccharide biosynthesis protein [Beijerinckiaceae bacterium]